MRTEEGHVRGAEALEKFLKFILDNNYSDYVVIYALSSWNSTKRSAEEVAKIVALENKKFLELLDEPRIYEKGVRITFTGNCEGVLHDITSTIKRITEKTQNHEKKTLNFLFNYDIDRVYFSDNDKYDLPDLDLVIRTGCKDKGKGLSGFLPFQTRYAELIFEDKYFPECDEEDFVRWLEKYKGNKKKRTFGS